MAFDGTSPPSTPMAKPAKLVPQAVPPTSSSSQVPLTVLTKQAPSAVHGHSPRNGEGLHKTSPIHVFRNYGIRDGIKKQTKKTRLPLATDPNWAIESYAMTSFILTIYEQVFFGKTSLWQKFLDDLYGVILTDDEHDLPPELQLQLVSRFIVTTLSCSHQFQVLNDFYQSCCNRTPVTFSLKLHQECVDRIFIARSSHGRFVMPEPIREIHKLLNTISYGTLFFDVAWARVDPEEDEDVEIVTVNLGALTENAGQKRPLSSDDASKTPSKRSRTEKSTYPSIVSLESLRICEGDTWAIIMKSGPLEDKEILVTKCSDGYSYSEISGQAANSTLKLSGDDRVQVVGVPLYILNLPYLTHIKLYGPRTKELPISQVILFEHQLQGTCKVAWRKDDQGASAFISNKTLVQVY